MTIAEIAENNLAYWPITLLKGENLSGVLLRAFDKLDDEDQIVIERFVRILELKLGIEYCDALEILSKLGILMINSGEPS